MVAVLACLASPRAPVAADGPAQAPAAGAVLEGPPVRYSLDVERYRFGTTDVSNPAFYPVFRNPVTRDSYLAVVEAMGPAELAANPKRGLDGPRVFMPVLVKYVQTGDAAWGEACIAMLRDFHEDVLRQTAAHGWVWQFEQPPALIPLYRRYLVAGGAMREDADWFREMWLCYCRNLHVWSSKPVEWRGGCHRAMPEAYVKGLAARWYPDIPEAGHWANYSRLVLDDYLRAGDVGQNDTGYMMFAYILLACCGEEWTQDDSLYTSPAARRLWERMLVEVTPDGFINPYGPNGGFNATADYRVGVLERAAAKTGDGRYRFAAHRLFNYLRTQALQAGRSPDRFEDGSAWHIALAWLFADESIAPLQPDAGSLWTTRTEAARIPVEDKKLIEKRMGNADPRPGYGQVCCGWFLTGKQWPDKLVLRSGWNPGDLFCLVELHPTSFPANPGGIMGLDRWGTPFTQIVTSKGASVENRALVEDLSGTVPQRLHPDTVRINETWNGRPPDIRSEVVFFRDTPQATLARIRVANVDGLPVSYEREFVFAKNRFLATRETVTFEEGFSARVAPVWNTANVGPQIGDHWANTFIHRPVVDNLQHSVPVPPADLLVWFAPRKDCRLHVIDRLVDDPRAEACPVQLRYAWEGRGEAGQRLVFTQVYYPHAPYRPRLFTNNPNPGQKATYADDIQATAHAAGIAVVRDDPDATILRLELEKDTVEWVAFNPAGGSLDVGGTACAETLVYRPATR
jgi:hypothetical protein